MFTALSSRSAPGTRQAPPRARSRRRRCFRAPARKYRELANTGRGRSGAARSRRRRIGKPVSLAVPVFAGRSGRWWCCGLASPFCTAGKMCVHVHTRVCIGTRQCCSISRANQDKDPVRALTGSGMSAVSVRPDRCNHGAAPPPRRLPLPRGAGAASGFTRACSAASIVMTAGMGRSRAANPNGD